MGGGKNNLGRHSRTLAQASIAVRQRQSPAVPERILVYGVTGSGKTALAERISVVTGIPWHAVDDLTWKPGWVQVPDAEQRRRIEAICECEQWVLDTAYGKWLDIPLARVDLVVALDFPRWVSLCRLIRRTVARLIDGRAVCNGNRDQTVVSARTVPIRALPQDEA